MTEENKAPETAEETTAPEANEAEETKTEEAAPEAAEEETNDVEVPEEFAKLIEQVEAMSVLELNQLVKVIEAKWGVSATAVAAAGPAAGGDDAGEQSEFEVELTSDGGAKIPVMKVIKEILGLGLKDAKEFVEGAPATVKAGLSKEEAEEMKAKIEEAGGKVELK